MAVFLGRNGNVRLRRGLRTPYALLEDEIKPDDVNTTLNRLSFDGALDNLITGDRIDLSTDDARGMVCFDAAAWSSGAVEPLISAYVHVNAVGGLRFFYEFENAINNNRAAELTLTEFAGNPLVVTVKVRDVSANVLGNVTGYTLNTDRETIDATALSDKFRKQYSAGLISGSGSIDCLFDYISSGIQETPLLMLQLIHRVDIGSEFDLALYLTDKELNPSLNNVYYEMEAMVTQTGVTVDSDDIIRCTIDFVTTGEIRLLIGEPVGYVLKEDNDRIEIEQSLDFLLKEVED
jgi:hypothetical protein